MDDIAVNSDLPDLCFVYVEENKSRRISVKMCFISDNLKNKCKALALDTLWIALSRVISQLVPLYQISEHLVTFAEVLLIHLEGTQLPVLVERHRQPRGQDGGRVVRGPGLKQYCCYASFKIK